MATDATELLAELQEERAENAADDRFRNHAALLVAVLAAILAIGGLGGGNATDDLIDYNIRATDTWAFFQAKNMRQTFYEIAAEELETRLSDPQTPAVLRPGLETRLADYRATIERYESEPDEDAPDDATRGDGKRQLMARAQAYEAERERAAAQDSNFDFAEVLLQLALVLASVAILAVNRPLLIGASLLGALGTLLTLNGFLLLVPLPL